MDPRQFSVKLLSNHFPVTYASACFFFFFSMPDTGHFHVEPHDDAVSPSLQHLEVPLRGGLALHGPFP